MGVLTSFSKLLIEYPPFLTLHNLMKCMHHNDIMSVKVNPVAPWSHIAPLEHNVEPSN